MHDMYELFERGPHTAVPGLFGFSPNIQYQGTSIRLVAASQQAASPVRRVYVGPLLGLDTQHLQ